MMFNKFFIFINKEVTYKLRYLKAKYMISISAHVNKI